MKIINTKISILIYAAILISWNSQGQVCRLADLAVRKLVITTVSGNQFRFDYTIQNVGASTLYLDRFYFQAYVSTDKLLGNDAPAGGSIFGNNAPALEYGETYTGSWTSNPTVSITDYNVLLFDVRLRPKYVQNECSLKNNLGVASIGCNLAELLISNISIKTVVGNTFTYSYTITNKGWSALPLNKFYFQTYVSANSVLDAGDSPAGGSIFGAAAPTLLHNESYTGTWSYNPTTPADLTVNPYLLFNVYEISGNQVQECNEINNYTQYIGCNLAELSITSITILTVSGNTFQYNFTIKNTGWAPLPLSKFMFQSYVSANTVLDAGDSPAGGAIFGSAAPTLNHDEIYTGFWYYNPTTPVDLTLNPYLLFHVFETSGNQVVECQETNETFKYILNGSLREAAISQEVSGSDYKFTSNPLEGLVSIIGPERSKLPSSYSLFTSSGQVIKHGEFSQDIKISTVGFSPGIYILRVTNQEQAATFKFVVE